MKIKRKLISAAEVLDIFKVTRRLTLFCYGYLVWHSVNLFFAIDNPTTEHTVVVSSVIGISAAIFGFYTNSPVDWSNYHKKKEERQPQITNRWDINPDDKFYN